MTIKPLVSLLNIGLSKEKVLSLYQEINDHVNFLSTFVFFSISVCARIICTYVYGSLTLMVGLLANKILDLDIFRD